MPFTKETLEFQGKTLVVQPIYAYGWSGLPEARSFDELKEFRLVVHEFFVWRDSISALKALIEEPDHEFHHYWVTAVPRIDDRLIDFRLNLGPCALVISPEPSIFGPSDVVPPNHPDAVVSNSKPTICGHGMKCSPKLGPVA